MEALDHRLSMTWAMLKDTDLVKGNISDQAMQKFEDCLNYGVELRSNQEQAIGQTFRWLFNSDREAFNSFLAASGKDHLLLLTAGINIARGLSLPDTLTLFYATRSRRYQVRLIDDTTSVDNTSRATNARATNARATNARDNKQLSIERPPRDNRHQPDRQSSDYKERRPKSNKYDKKKDSSYQFTKQPWKPLDRASHEGANKRTSEICKESPMFAKDQVDVLPMVDGSSIDNGTVDNSPAVDHSCNTEALTSNKTLEQLAKEAW